VTVHEAAVGATVEWYTPASLFAALGDPEFDLDPCAGRDGDETDLFNRVPARRKWTAVLDGLSKPWEGHVWLNPPFGPGGVPFVERMLEHRDGIMLLPSRTETRMYQRAFDAADLVCFLRDRLWFVRNDGVTGRSSFGSTLFAFGSWAAFILQAADLGVLVEVEKGAR
jgi:hypothetical protein